jgi:outer membrane biosynthesis protein TonB
MFRFQSLVRLFVAAAFLPVAFAFCSVLAPVLNLSASAQQPPAEQQPAATQLAPGATPNPTQTPATPQPAQQPAPALALQAPTAEPPSAPKPAATQSSRSQSSSAGEITEEELKRQLVGKPLYLRGGYLDNSLSFDEHGALIDHSPQGSYTLSAIQIDKVRLTKRKLELEGSRYGLHFLGALPNEDPTRAVDRVNITPSKKMVRITIDREVVVSPKNKKEKAKRSNKGNESQADAIAPASAATASAPLASQPDEASKPQAAAVPPADRPADRETVTETVTPAQAAKALRDALDSIFAPGIDDRLMASMPAFWRLYYQAAAANTDYRPSDPAVLRQNMVDKKATLITTFEPESNEYAQAHAVSGMALYHTVIGADGKPGEIAVGRPIGFGLDENAVEAIRKATFEPAIKDGKPVPVLLDLVVQFRIYSNRTADKPEAAKPAEVTPAEPQLPGPYSIPHP